MNTEMGAGWAYFVDHKAFAKELARVKGSKQDEVYIAEWLYLSSFIYAHLQKSTCDSTHSAIERAHTRINDGFAVTGVVGVVDSRHGFIRPSSMVDLQRGETSVLSAILNCHNH
jgi:hypothetical protein